MIKIFVSFIFSYSVLLSGCGYPRQITLSSPTTQTQNTTATLASVTSSSNLSLTPPCESFNEDATPIPFLAELTSEIILDPQKAVSYSDQLLLCRGIVPDDHDGAVAVPITFENGEHGIFVALGYGPRIGGYQLLYRERGKTVRLESFEGSALSWESAPVEFIGLFPQTKKRWVFKLNGYFHQGTGMRQEQFELVEVTEQGAHNLFNGTLLNTSEYKGGRTAASSFTYTDLDNDGIKEIIETGALCEYAQGNDLILVKTNCKEIAVTYKYDGTRYYPTH